MEEGIINVSAEGKVHSLSEVHDQVNWNQGGTRRQQTSQQDETASDNGTHVVESTKEEGPPSAELIHFVGITCCGVVGSHRAFEHLDAITVINLVYVID